MTCKDTETLIKKYLNGETTAEEEKRLALEVSREDAPADWQIIAGMLGELVVDEALFDHMMAERKSKPRIVKLWPWVAAACVAVILVIFLGPPREENITNLQIAKVEPVNAVEEKAIEPKEKILSQVTAMPQQIHRQKRKKGVAKRTTTARQIVFTEQVDEPMHKSDDLAVVDKSDNAPSDDPRVQFAEQARILRERGNRVIQRVSMNANPPINHHQNNL